jgi:putative transposase
MTPPPSWASQRASSCAEHGIRTLKEQCLWAEFHDSVDALRQAVAGSLEPRNAQWLIGRLGHRTPEGLPGRHHHRIGMIR